MADIYVKLLQKHPDWGIDSVPVLWREEVRRKMQQIDNSDDSAV